MRISSSGSSRPSPQPIAFCGMRCALKVLKSGIATSLEPVTLSASAPTELPSCVAKSEPITERKIGSIAASCAGGMGWPVVGSISGELSELSASLCSTIEARAEAIPSASGSTSFCQPSTDASSHSLRLQADDEVRVSAGKIVASLSQRSARSSAAVDCAKSIEPTGSCDCAAINWRPISRIVSSETNDPEVFALPVNGLKPKTLLICAKIVCGLIPMLWNWRIISCIFSGVNPAARFAGSKLARSKPSGLK